ncbi:MAG: cysteine hydrolase [Oscillospiraceae bacterium]|nr:isochorismatase family protein [Oscillospiraceae bacterium]MCR4758999.1 cysteine hydrolase [Oscillospiraceae bacterium]
MKALIVIDMQKDFTTGVLGNPETAAVVKPVVKKIKAFRKENPDGLVIATLDTHTEDYLNTQEGRKLPVPHCIKGTNGWKLETTVKNALGEDAVLLEKVTFGAADLPKVIGKRRKIEEFQVIGVCTDICVISNAMILKAAFPEVPVKVFADCCAGVTPQSHDNALAAMQACQIEVESGIAAQ